MKCPNEISFREFIDKEIPERIQKDIEFHIYTCKRCQNTVQEIRDKNALIKEKIKQLNPDEIFREPFKAPQRFHKKAYSFSSFERLFFGSIRIPVPLLGLLLGITVFLFSELVIQIKKTTPLKPTSVEETQPMTLYFSGSNSIQSFNLDLNLEKYAPIKNPDVIVIKEISE